MVVEHWTGPGHPKDADYIPSSFIKGFQRAKFAWFKGILIPVDGISSQLPRASAPHSYF